MFVTKIRKKQKQEQTRLLRNRTRSLIPYLQRPVARLNVAQCIEDLLKHSLTA